MKVKHKIAICVGHSCGDGGAVSLGGVNEWHYNRKLGRLITNDLAERGHEVEFIDRYAQAPYGLAMRQLAKRLLEMGATAAVELHFNDSDQPKATGHEWLFWHSSVPARALAQSLNLRMFETFPELKWRGLCPISGNRRGAGFLRKTHCPAVICEPFFGSNANDWELATAHRDLLARVIADGIDDWMGGAE